MNMEIEQNETSIIFLGMFCGGGGPYAIPEIIRVYDWINRAIPTREEMEVALNTLLAMGLIEQQDNKFLIPEPQYRRYDEFQKRKRKNRFDAVKMYFKQLPGIANLSQVIAFTEEQYDAHVEENSRAFAEALRRMEKKER
jgi:hypothetical protein